MSHFFEGKKARTKRYIAATASITAYDACIDGINFSIVDTPGFNDTYQNESQILAKLAGWLSSTYRDGRRLSGLIYLHSIAKSRMSGTSRLNLSMFQKLCGQHSYENITLCTTFWDSVNHSVGESRESQLFTRDDFWGNMIQRGAKTERIHDYSDLVSRRVLQRFADKGEVVLTVQKEMVDNNKPLEQTAASQVVNTELDRALESFRIREFDIEQELAQREMKRHLQNQQSIEHQQSIRDLDEKYRREAKEREKQALEAKEKEKRRAQERLQHQEEENRRKEEQRAAEKREQAAKEAERRKLERKRKEESLRQQTSEHFRKIFARQCRALYSAQCSNKLTIRCHKNEDQHAGYLRWCDHCFVPIRNQSHFRKSWPFGNLVSMYSFDAHDGGLDCQQCQFDICSTCWNDGGRCKQHFHNPRYKVPSSLNSCNRISHGWSQLTCDSCKTSPPGLFFRKLNSLLALFSPVLVAEKDISQIAAHALVTTSTSAWTVPSKGIRAGIDTISCTRLPPGHIFQQS